MHTPINTHKFSSFQNCWFLFDYELALIQLLVLNNRLFHSHTVSISALEKSKAEIEDSCTSLKQRYTGDILSFAAAKDLSGSIMFITIHHTFHRFEDKV